MAKQLNVDMRFTADTSKAKQQIQELQTAIQKLGYGGPVKNEMVDPKQFEQAASSARELAYHLNNAYNAKTGNLDLSKLNSSLKQSGTSLTQLTANFKNAGTVGQQAFVSLAKTIAMADQPALTINAHLSTMFTTLKNVARFQISSSIMHGLIGGVQTAFNYAKDLNQSLNNISIVTGQSTSQMARFAEQANKTARSLSATTLDYTNAALIYYQQGLDDETVKARTDVTVKLANVSRQSAEEVSSQMTAIWNNFDDGSHSIEYFADVITALGATTASSSEEIATGLSKFAPVAGTIGLSYEKASAALAAIIANTRQSADTVGTGLRTIFSRFESLKLGETLEDGVNLSKYTKAMQTIGVNVLDANGKLKDMDTILDEVAKRWEKLDNTQKTAFATTVGGVRQYTNLIALFDNWDDVLKNLSTANESEGTLQAQADIFATGWEGARNRVRAAAEGIYDSLIDEDFFIEIDNMIEHLLTGVKNFIDSFGGIKTIAITTLSLIGSIVSTKIGPAIEQVIQNIGVLTGRAGQSYQNIQKEFQAIISSQNQNSSYTEAQQQELINAERLLNAKTNLSAVENQLSASEKMRAQLAIEGLQLQQDKLVELQNQLETYRNKQEEARQNLEANAVLSSDQDFKRINKEYYRQADLLDSKDTSSFKDLKAWEDASVRALENARANIIQRIKTEGSTKTPIPLSELLFGATTEINAVFEKQLTDSLSSLDIPNMIRNIKGFGGKKNGPEIIEKLFPNGSETIEKGTAFIKNYFQVLDNLSDKTKARLQPVTDAINNAFSPNIPKFQNAVRMIMSGLGDVIKLSPELQTALQNALTAGDVSSIMTALSALDQAVREGKLSVEDYNRALNAIGLPSVDVSSYNRATDEVKKLEEEVEKTKQTLENMPPLNFAHLVTGTEVLTQTFSSFGQLYSIIRSITSLMETWSNKDLSFGEKLTSSLMSLSMLFPSVIGVIKTYNTILDFSAQSETRNALAIFARTAAQREGMTEEIKANAVRQLTLKGIDKDTAVKAINILATQDLATAEGRLAAVEALTSEGIKKETAEYLVQTGAISGASVAKIFFSAITKKETKETAEATLALIAQNGALWQQVAARTALAILKNPWVGAAAVVAIGVATAAILAQNKALKEQQKQREELSKTSEKLNKTAEEAKEEYKSIESLLDAYERAKFSLDDTQESKNNLKAATEDLCAALGVEWSALDKLQGKYEEVNKEILEHAVIKAKDAYEKAKEAQESNQNNLIWNANQIGSRDNKDRLTFSPAYGVSSTDKADWAVQEKLREFLNNYLTEQGFTYFDDFVTGLDQETSGLYLKANDKTLPYLITGIQEFYNSIGTIFKDSDIDVQASEYYTKGLPKLTETLLELSQAVIESSDLSEEESNLIDTLIAQAEYDIKNITSMSEYDSMKTTIIEQLLQQLKTEGITDISSDDLSQQIDNYLLSKGFVSEDIVLGNQAAPEIITKLNENGISITEEEIQKYIDEYGSEVLLKINFDTITSKKQLEEILKSYHNIVEKENLEIKLSVVQDAKKQLEKFSKGGMTADEYQEFQTSSGITWGENGYIKYIEFLELTYEQQIKYLEDVITETKNSIQESKNNIDTAIDKLEGELSDKETTKYWYQEQLDKLLKDKIPGWQDINMDTDEMKPFLAKLGFTEEDISSIQKYYTSWKTLSEEMEVDAENILALKEQIGEESLTDQEDIDTFLTAKKAAEEYTASLTKLYEKEKQIGSSFSQEEIDFLSQKVGLNINDYFTSAGDGVYRLINGVEDLQETLRNAKIKDLFGTDTTEEFSENQKVIAGMATSFQDLISLQKDYGLSNDAYQSGLKNLAAQYEDCQDELNKYNEALASGTQANIEQAEKELIAALLEHEAVLKQVTAATEKYNKIEGSSKNLKRGDTVDRETFNLFGDLLSEFNKTLNIDDYFTFMDDGTVMLTADAEKFYELVHQAAVAELEQSIQAQKNAMSYFENEQQNTLLFSALQQTAKPQDQGMQQAQANLLTSLGITDATGQLDTINEKLKTNQTLTQEEIEYLTNMVTAAVQGYSSMEEVYAAMGKVSQENEEQLAATARSLKELDALDISDEAKREGLQKLAAGYKECHDELDAFQEALKSGKGIDEAEEALRAAVAQATSDIALKNVYKNIHDVIDKLSTGDTISEEKFEELFSGMDEYFIQMADGTRMLIADAEEFYNLVNEKSLKQLSAANNFENSIYGTTDTGYSSLQGVAVKAGGIDLEKAQAQANFLTGAGYSDTTGQLEEIISALDNGKQLEPDQIVALENMTAELQEAYPTLEAYIDAFGNAGEKIATTVSNVGELEDISDQYNLTQEQITKGYVKLATQTDAGKQALAKYQKELKEAGNDTKKAETATRKFEKAIKDIQADEAAKNIKEISDSLEDLNDYKADQIADELQSVFGKNITGEWVQNNKNLVKQWLDGTEEERQAVANIMDSVGNIDPIKLQVDDSGLWTAEQQIQAFTEAMANNNPEIDVNGKADMSAVVAELLRAGMTAEQVANLLASVGQTDVSFAPGSFNIRPFPADGDADAVAQWMEDFSAQMGNLDLNVSSFSVPAGGIPQMNTGGSKGGGGGGGKTSTKEKKDPTEEKDRYHTITEKIEDAKNAYEKLSKAEDRAFGRDKLKAMTGQTNNLKQQVDLQKRYIQEIRDYLKGDQAEVAALGATFDANGVINNYDALIESLVKEYNKGVDKFNAGSIDEEKFKEQYEEPFNKAKESIDQYVKTINLLQSEELNLIDLQNQLADSLRERIEAKIKIDIDLSEDDLKLLEYYLDKLEDNAYDAAEAIGLIGKQVEEWLGQAEDYQNSINDLLKTHLTDEEIQKFNEGLLTTEDLLNKGFTEQDVEDLRTWNESLLDINKSLDEAAKTVGEKFMTSLSSLNDEIEESQERFDQLTSIVEHYENIIDIVGKDNLGIADSTLALLRGTVVDAAIAEVNTAKHQLDSFKAIRQEIIDRLSSGELDEAGRAYWEEQQKKVEQELYQAQEDYMSSFEDAVQGIFDSYSKTLTDAINTFLVNSGLGDSLGGLKDYLKEADEQNVSSTTKVYELTKLTRDIQKSMDESPSIKGKTKLLELQNKISDAMKDGKEYSQAQLDILRKEYELMEAQLALEDMAQAKSTVRMSRDNEGNWSYVYVADEEKIANAEQELDDKLYEYNQLVEEQYQELLTIAEDMTTAWAEEYQAIMEDTTITDEERMARLALLNETYQEALDDLNEKQAWMVEQADVLNQEEYQSRAKAIDIITQGDEHLQNVFENTAWAQAANLESMEETLAAFTENSQLLLATGAQAYEDYQDANERAFQAAGYNIEQFTENGIQNSNYFATAILNDADEIKDAISTTETEANNLAENMKTMMESIANFINKWKENYTNAIDEICKFNEKLVASCNELIKQLNATQQAQIDAGGGADVGGTEGGGSSRYGYIETTSGNNGGSTSNQTSSYTPSQTSQNSPTEKQKKKTGGCFSPGTKITMGDLTIKNIEDIQVGDFVLAYNEDSKIFESKKVIHSFAHYNTIEMLDIYLSNGTILEATACHPILTTDGWKSLNHDIALYEHEIETTPLEIGQEVICQGDNLIITNIIWKEDIPNFTTYNITVEDIHTYIANGIIVHNMSMVASNLKMKSGGYTGTWPASGLTGMYTGSWNGPDIEENGKLAFLHQKELVLNASDTENMLSAVKLIREISRTIDLQALISSQGIGALLPGSINSANNVLDQNVHIDASFPNVTNHIEIEEAFHNLVGKASQFAQRNKT